MTTEDYIKEHCLEVPEHLWSGLGFAQFMKANNHVEYQIIMDDIDFDELHDAVTDSDVRLGNLLDAENLVIHAFKQEIRSWVDDLQGEIDDKEEMPCYHKRKSKDHDTLQTFCRDCGDEI